MLQEGAEFLQQIGVGLVPQVLINGVPMKQVDVLGESFEEAIVTTILRMTSDLQSYVTQVGCDRAERETSRRHLVDAVIARPVRY